MTTVIRTNTVPDAVKKANLQAVLDDVADAVNGRLEKDRVLLWQDVARRRIQDATPQEGSE